MENENDTDSDHEEAADNEHSQNEQSIEKQTQDHGDQQTQDHGDKQTQDSENVAVKPPLLAKFRFAHDTIEISSDSDNGDVPDQEENELESDNDDCILDRVVPPKFDCITRERNYGCYVCLQMFEMQQSFVIHFQNQHPELPFRCEFCSSDFQSPNGLFKHERSHEYLKYKCLACNKKFQFPYQLKAQNPLIQALIDINVDCARRILVRNVQGTSTRDHMEWKSHVTYALLRPPNVLAMMLH